MVIKTKLLQRTNILGITLWPFIIVRPNVSERTMNHERIHLEQQKELWVIPFYLIYLWWSIRYGYYNNPFEVEAYNYDKYDEYMNFRKKYNYFKK